MFNQFSMPPVGFGPGSQPTEDEGKELSYMPLPSGMRTFEPTYVDIDDAERAAPAIALLREVADACDEAARLRVGRSLDLSELDPANRKLVAETLGQGEVSCIIDGANPRRAQETVFAGVWVVIGEGVDRIEVAPVPRDVMMSAFHATGQTNGPVSELPRGVVNAPALITELRDRSAAWKPGTDVHVINLSLLPHTPEDLEFLDAEIGTGAVTILSRGYGNCRVTATATDHVWRVQFFNSMDVLILDTFEVTDVPEVALAAQEDLEDSAARIITVLESIE